MKISDIYTKYKLMPSLQLHMFRVASVGNIICDSLTGIPNQVRDDEIAIEKNNVISACLLHDMGNILKFNLDLFPDFLQPQGKEYWQRVKDDYENRYGKDEHEATIQIGKELGVEERIIELIDAFKFSAAKENYEGTDFEKKICTYSDMRVEPRKVVSLEERLIDGRKRFKLNQKHIEEDEDFFNIMAGYLKKIQEEIFSQSTITPELITDQSISSYISKFSDFEILGS